MFTVYRNCQTILYILKVKNYFSFKAKVITICVCHMLNNCYLSQSLNLVCCVLLQKGQMHLKLSTAPSYLHSPSSHICAVCVSRVQTVTSQDRSSISHIQSCSSLNQQTKGNVRLSFSVCACVCVALYREIFMQETTDYTKEAGQTALLLHQQRSFNPTGYSLRALLQN